MNLSEILNNEILSTVEKPSRYLGTEVNATHKRREDVDVRISLVFPDLYDLGLGNLGILILYSILNDLPWCWCERAYAPATDMEEALRARDLPLFCNESKDSLGDMDLIGFTLQSELTYTNILTCIDLAGLPLRSRDRAEDAPLVFAGGPAVFNPEPLSPFIDFFVIGDGEDVILEIAETMRSVMELPRIEKLKAFAAIDGVYVPELYPFETLPDGQILPKEDAPKIVKRVVATLDGAKFPTNYIVPFTQQVHDRLALEVLRGCTQGCRFCQAGMTTRPVRERTLKNIDQLMEKALANTGYEEVSLVSLSTCDYSRPLQLIEQTSNRAAKDRVSVSLPSLRLDSFSVEMADRVADVRRSGLTFAPEAATPRLRAVINKWIPDEGLLDMAREAYKRDWQHVKCYFMIGLPTERDEDVEAIGDLCIRTLKVGREINPKARVHLGVSTFVPKPFTPFQWAEQIDMDETERRQGILDAAFKGNGAIKFGRHYAKTTFIEGLITRADRRAADLIEAAWRNGARFESWDEKCDLDAWQKAIDEVNYDVYAALRERDIHERLPWDHIDVLIPKQWFQDDYQNATELKHAQDCRAGKCHMCGVIFRERELCQHMLKNQRRGRIEERDRTPEPVPVYVEPEAVQRLRLRIGRSGEVRFLSHLEWLNAWIRALRRAKAPLSYSQGFHAHPKVTFAGALPVGEESQAEYMDVILKERLDADALLTRLCDTLPEGFHAFDVEEVPLRTASLMSSVRGYTYTITVETDNADALQTRIDELMASDVAEVQRKTKAKIRGRGRGRRGPHTRRPQKTVDIRGAIEYLAIREVRDGYATLEFTTAAPSIQEPGTPNGSENTAVLLAKPREILHLLDLDWSGARIVKQVCRLEDFAVAAESW
ncbi:MAG: TIGR03960 family B12-binding radical SAM protein [Candidatus Hydrogenedentes bacterium]|nr:TIGR03960 family B12-binding radical SAM protein [Candidatus Hydrogenedentota bacterium]